jgi:hypothetical protein
MLVVAMIPKITYEGEYKGGGTHIDGAHTHLIFNLSYCHPLLLLQDVILCGKTAQKALSYHFFLIFYDDDKVACSAS